MTKSTFVKYAEIKSEIAALEHNLDELKPLIMEEMPDQPVDLEGYGTFSMVAKKKWSYPDTVENIRETLKEAEKLAQQTGEATYEENPYLLFKPTR